MTWSGFSLCPFWTMEYISGQTKFLPPIQFSTYWALKLLFYILQHNVPRISHSHLQTVFSSFIYSIVRKWESWTQIKSMETTLYNRDLSCIDRVPNYFHLPGEPLVWMLLFGDFLGQIFGNLKCFRWTPQSTLSWSFGLTPEFKS